MVVRQRYIILNDAEFVIFRCTSTIVVVLFN